MRRKNQLYPWMNLTGPMPHLRENLISQIGGKALIAILKGLGNTLGMIGSMIGHKPTTKNRHKGHLNIEFHNTTMLMIPHTQHVMIGITLITTIRGHNMIRDHHSQPPMI